tara:strand:+ start:324 stop:1046 length:723 start_codon:yes stop_codon:yes gene_type:complete
MILNYKNQNVLVTGATRGIGRRLAEDMATLGANVTATGTSSNYKPFTSGINFHQANFLSDESTDRFTSFVSDMNFDVVINNAGINKIDSICEIDTKDWDDIIAVNLTAPLKVLKAVTPGMKERGYGRVVNIASIWGSVSIPHRAAYSASKTGLKGLTRAVAAEMAAHNVLVNTVSPGFTLTDLTRKVLGEEKMKEICKLIPMKRMATPEEISKVVLFMASDLNTYISGQDIIADGGFVNV